VADDWNTPKDPNHPHNQGPPAGDHQQPPQQWQQQQPEYYEEYEESGGSGIPGWLIWVGLLLLVNGLSCAFDWGFIIY
jgi:hypothetical protein